MASPVVLSVPHAGRAYPAALLRASRLPLVRLETLEDRLVDHLVALTVEAGAAAIVAEAPRAEIDLNRDERELDPGMIAPRPRGADLLDTPRTRGGLGLVPARMAGTGAIWRERIAASEIDRRIAAIHRPYHEALANALQEARRRFGIAVLLDCHSMPPRAAREGESQVVLGDRHGTSAAPELMAAAERAVREAGYPVARNDPYAGGHITMRHGRPERGIHAIQIELDRGTYLAPDLRAPGPGFERAARLIKAVTEALAAAALQPPQTIAAE
ncbi:MAG TPA: N-formylglutamate amidohydrolase [Allosphingosinicella sp.]|nr:N-formylglutamate amidohydrolase [Allosphingosinicella sp.]